MRRCTRNYWTIVHAAKLKQLAFLPIPYDKPLLFNRMFLIQRHVVQSWMKIMFRGLALKYSSFLPKLITGGAFWSTLQGSADSNVCLHARVLEHVCRDLRESITQQFWQRQHTLLRPLFWISLVCTWPKFPFNPCPCLLSSKNKLANKMSKERHQCTAICIMETHTQKKNEPSKKALPSEVSGVFQCNGTEQAIVYSNYWSYPERCVELIKTLCLMCIPWKAAGNGIKECTIDRDIRYYWNHF